MTVGANQNVAQVIPLGPGAIIFNGVDLGHTDDNGIKATRKVKLVVVKVGLYGDSEAAAPFYNGESIELDATLMQTNMAILGAAFPLANIITNGTNSRLAFGNIAGTRVASGSLIVQSQTPGNDPADQYNFTAYPAGDFEAVYTGGKISGYKIKFKAIVNTTAAIGSLLGGFGDPSITADSVAPTSTNVVPADAATGVAESTTVVWTFSKALNGQTVNTQTVMVLKGSTGQGAAVAGAVVLANNGASTTITFTPTSSLSTGIYYAVIAPGAVMGQNNVAFAGTETEFTCV